MSRTVLFVCGGTGGHVFPAVAIAESMRQRGVERIVFAGRKNSMEEKLVAAQWEFVAITAVPLRRGSIVENLLMPARLCASVLKAWRVVGNVRPDCVVATGGYVSLPVVIAAGLRRIPVYLQEQNAVAGVANRVGAFFAKKIFVTSEEAARAFSAEKVQIFGNPVRALPKQGSLPAPAEFSQGKRNVLVLGGSQGAIGINVKMENAVSRIAAAENVSVVWQAGARNHAAISGRVGSVPGLHLVPFLDNVYAYMIHADLIVSRAGASTLAEILAFGKPSILLPFPFATANHQEHNARVVEKAGGAWVELDSDPDDLWNKVERLLNDATTLQRMSQSALKLGMPDAADRIAEVVLKLQEKKS